MNSSHNSNSFWHINIKNISKYGTALGKVECILDDDENPLCLILKKSKEEVWRTTCCSNYYDYMIPLPHCLVACIVDHYSNHNKCIDYTIDSVRYMDGTEFISGKITSIDFGDDYICINGCKSWIFSHRCHLWLEMEGDVEIEPYRLVSYVEKKRILINGFGNKKEITTNEKAYLDRYIYKIKHTKWELFCYGSEGEDSEWKPVSVEYSVIDYLGNLIIKPIESENLAIKTDNAFIIINDGKEFFIYSNNNNKGLKLVDTGINSIKEEGRYLILLKEEKQAIVDSFLHDNYIECKVSKYVFDKKYSLLTQTISEGYIGAYEIIRNNQKQYHLLSIETGQPVLSFDEKNIRLSPVTNGVVCIYYTEDPNLGITRQYNLNGEIVKEKSWWIESSEADFQDDIDKDCWYGLTDGMYGDYD